MATYRAYCFACGVGVEVEVYNAIPLTIPCPKCWQQNTAFEPYYDPSGKSDGRCRHCGRAADSHQGRDWRCPR